jgi:hypothetical protein
MSRLGKGSHFLSGLSFMLRIVPKKWNIKEESIYSPISKKIFRVKFFFPTSYSQSKTPAILLFHGMNISGIDDIRIIEVAIRLSKAGFLVIVPELEEVKNLIITPETIDNINDLIVTISQLKNYFDPNRLGIFSISFTGGLGLIAASRENVRDKISSILVVGGHASFENTLSFVIKNFNHDDYATYVLLYNYIEKILDDALDLKTIFFEAALDNILFRKENDSVAQKLRSNLNSRDKEIFDKVKNDFQFREEIGNKIRLVSKSLIDSLSPIFYIEGIRAKVSLIHGKNDIVVSESESLYISNEFIKNKKVHNLEITPLLSHADKVSVWKQLPAVPSLAVAFGYFLESI